MGKAFMRRRWGSDTDLNDGSLDEFYCDDIVEESPKRGSSKQIKVFSILLLFTFGTTYAANINLDLNNKAEFGQGILQMTACDPQVTLKPKLTFSNSDNTHLLTGFSVSDIGAGCENKNFRLRAFDSMTNLALPLYSYNGVDYSEVNIIFAPSNSQPGDGGIQIEDISSGTDSFEVLLNGSTGSPARVALTNSINAARFTLETSKAEVAGALPSSFGGSLTFTTVRSGPWPTLDYSGSEFVFGTGDFTVELWAKYPGVTTANPMGNSAFYDAGGEVNNPGGFAFWVESSQLKIRVNGTNDFGVPWNSAWTDNWVHLAAVRSSGVIKIYVDGQAQTLNPSPDTNMAADIDRSTPRIGALAFDNWSDYGLFGEITNLRVVKGRAVYTSNFAKPTSSLTAVPGTVLLLRADDSNNATSDSSNYGHLPVNNLTIHQLPTWNSAKP